MRLDFLICSGAAHFEDTSKLGTAARDWGTARNVWNIAGWAQQG